MYLLLQLRENVPMIIPSVVYDFESSYSSMSVDVPFWSVTNVFGNDEMPLI